MLFQDSQAYQGLLVSQAQWDHRDLLEMMVLDTVDHRVHQGLLDLQVIVNRVSLELQVALGNQATTVLPVREVPLAQLDPWDPEVHLVLLEVPDLLDCPLLGNLDLLDSLGLQAQEENLA